jgi:hypothetical protein
VGVNVFVRIAVRFVFVGAGLEEVHVGTVDVRVTEKNGMGLIGTVVGVVVGDVVVGDVDVYSVGLAGVVGLRLRGGTGELMTFLLYLLLLLLGDVGVFPLDPLDDFEGEAVVLVGVLGETERISRENILRERGLVGD